jgi:hypothetical protein
MYNYITSIIVHAISNLLAQQMANYVVRKGSIYRTELVLKTKTYLYSVLLFFKKMYRGTLSLTQENHHF